jgi:2-polyprenyl-3-methyl-5-hydroxy-6-metoxy-1,4-benzoquinol methylase
MEYINKEKQIIDTAKNKKVLHLGCVGFADLETSERVKLAKESLHFQLSEIADTTGIDYSSDAIKFYQENDIFDNVLFGNVEKLEQTDINDTFDVIVAGDIIEHISNPGLMMEGIKKFCNKDTVIIITTPHSFGLLSHIRFLFNRFTEGNEHVMTFNTQNIVTLLERHGFTVDSLDTCYQKNSMSKPMFFVGKKVFELFPKHGGTLFVRATYKTV